MKNVNLYAAILVSGLVFLASGADWPQWRGPNRDGVAPAGPFRPMLRIYIPGAALLDGSYALPPIRRTA